mgnify:CR=1 FL=1
MSKKKIFAIVATLVSVGGGLWYFYASQNVTSNGDISTSSAIKGADWNPTVKLSFTGNSVTMEPNGIPDHARDAYYAVPIAGVVVPDASTATIVKDPTVAQSYNFSIPTNPEYTSKVTSTSMGSIGVMISGAVLYNPYEGDGKTVAMANNFTITDSKGRTASFVDSCAGHPTPQQGAYHYHGLSNCTTAKVDEAGQASHIIGFALDGFPIYGDRDVNGKQLTYKNLDQCNGIKSPTPEFPQGIYHYVLLPTNDVHSSISCFHGKVDENQMQPMPAMGDGQTMQDLTSAAKALHVSEAALKDALGASNRPDISAAAKKLGVTEQDLIDALGAPPKN